MKHWQPLEHWIFKKGRKGSIILVRSLETFPSWFTKRNQERESVRLLCRGNSRKDLRRSGLDWMPVPDRRNPPKSTWITATYDFICLSVTPCIWHCSRKAWTRFITFHTFAMTRASNLQKYLSSSVGMLVTDSKVELLRCYSRWMNLFRMSEVNTNFQFITIFLRWNNNWVTPFYNGWQEIYLVCMWRPRSSLTLYENVSTWEEVALSTLTCCPAFSRVRL